MAYILVKENGSEQKVDITGNISIGKKSDNNIVLKEITSSRRHCNIISSNNSFALEDLGSRNGTFLNGRKIGTREILKNGDIIQIGKCYIKFLNVKNNGAAEIVPERDSQLKTIVESKDAKSQKPKELSPQQVAAAKKHLELKKVLHEKLLDKLDLKKMGGDVSDEQLRKQTAAALEELIRTENIVPPTVNKKGLIKEITDESVGLGPLEDLLADDDIDEIMVNNFDLIYVEKKGKIEITDKWFTSNEQVIQAIRRIIAPLGRRIDETSPLVDARLKDGSRVNAIISPLAISGPTLTIRKFSKTPFTIQDLINFGSMTPKAAQLLEMSVSERKNILISGGTGSGKTTLLNVIASFIPETERIVTIEDAAELQLPQTHVVTLEAKPPNMDGKGAIPIRKLLVNSLRMRPDRIVVGECRGGEALDMLQAMNTGHDGSMTTLHANTCRDALSRLETLVLMAGMDLPISAIRNQIASAIDMIVQTQRLKDGTRRITSISELVGMEGDMITLQEVFYFDQRGYDDDGKIIGEMVCSGAVPSFVFDLKDRGIPVDMKIFEKTD
ncbi:MAG: pilus assembly protein TadA [Planctomycetota bacterium]|nr:MAG: pilus assembly protein TadA [Planctomycetota bacterium]